MAFVDWSHIRYLNQMTLVCPSSGNASIIKCVDDDVDDDDGDKYDDYEDEYGGDDNDDDNNDDDHDNDDDEHGRDGCLFCCWSPRLGCCSLYSFVYSLITVPSAATSPATTLSSRFVTALCYFLITLHPLVSRRYYSATVTCHITKTFTSTFWIDALLLEWYKRTSES